MPALRCSRCRWKLESTRQEDALVRAATALEQHLYEAHAFTFQRASEESRAWLEPELAKLLSSGEDGERS